jgi:uncharacterized membrane protein YfcA
LTGLITDPLFYLLAVPLILLFGMGKGGLGAGLGTLTVPILSFVINPVVAAAIILPILCVADLFALYHFRKHFDIHHLKILIPAGIVGIFIASVFMSRLNQDATRALIGIIAILFCLDYWLRPDVSKIRVLGRWGGYFWGAMAGFTSTQIHAGAAPISIYLFPQKLDKVVLIGTITIFFMVINYVKLIPYALMGALSAENLMTSLVLMPVAPIGVKLGNVLLHKINQKIFYRWLYLVLFLSGIKLCWDGLF